MPLFSFISGYFNSKSSRSTKEKVISILKIYIFAQVFYSIINKVLFEVPDSKLELFTPNWTMWYFLSLISWYIISDYIKSKKTWFIISMLISIYIGFDESVGSYASISRTFFFLPYFILGMCFKEEYIEKLRKYKYLFAVASLVFLIVLNYISDSLPIELFFEYTKYSYYFNIDASPFYTRIFHYVGSFIIGGFILSVAPTIETKLSIIGKNSLVLYVSHSFIIKYLTKYSYIEYSTIFNTIISEFIVIFITISVSLLYSLLKVHFLKFIPKLSRRYQLN